MTGLAEPPLAAAAVPLVVAEPPFAAAAAAVPVPVVVAEPPLAAATAPQHRAAAVLVLHDAAVREGKSERARARRRREGARRREGGGPL